MKKLLAMFLALVFAFALVACAPESNNDGDQSKDNEQGNQNGYNVVIPVEKEPTYAFSPYGTWVWEGNDKFTMTLNEDGTAVFSDNAENSYINLYPRLQTLWMSTQNTFTYTDGTDRLQLHLKVDDRNADIDYKIKYGNGYYILYPGTGGYSFVRAENYEEAHRIFTDGPIRETWTDISPLKPGDVADLFPDNEVKFKLDKIELNENYDLKVYCTLSAKTGVSSFDWINWNLYVKGEGGLRSDRLYFYDLNGQEVDGLKDGQTVEGYFTIESVDEEQSMTWYGELKAGIYISGMYTGVGCYIILPTQPT